jgi:virginiamycin B lyase
MSRWRLLAVVCMFLAGCDGGEAADTTATSAIVATTVAPRVATTLPPGTTTAPSTTVAPTSTTTEAVYLDPDVLVVESFPVPAGSGPHDVAPAADGGVWYTAQHLGELGWLDPTTGDTVHISLGDGSRPHGVIVDGAGTPWITDGGLNAIVSVDPSTREVTVYSLPDDHPDANLNTAVFAEDGRLWFTGQSGIYGVLDTGSGEMTVYDAPQGRGPYGITATPDGDVYYASLAGSYVGKIEPDGAATILEPTNEGQGARRVWSDSAGAIWVSEWNSGSLSRYQPGSGEWATWPLSGESPAAYAVYVDEIDVVWVSDFGANAIVRFDPATEDMTTLALPSEPGEVRQIHGRTGEVWGAESAADSLILIRTR